MKVFCLLCLLCLALPLSAAPAPVPRPRKPAAPSPAPRVSPVVGSWRMLWRGQPYPATFHPDGTYSCGGWVGHYAHDEARGRLLVEEGPPGCEVPLCWEVVFLASRLDGFLAGEDSYFSLEPETP